MYIRPEVYKLKNLLQCLDTRIGLIPKDYFLWSPGGMYGCTWTFINIIYSTGKFV